MKVNSKILCLVITVCLMLGLVSAVYASVPDVSGHWAQTEIEKWVSQGLATGYPDGTFKPDNNVTRAEFIALVNRACGYSQSTQSSFSDVKSTDWFAGDIAKANAAGYISGYEDGTIRPNNQISRQEAAVIIARIVKLSISENLEAVNKFKDVGEIPKWSMGSIGAVVANGFMIGYPDQNYKPEKAITRAEAISTLDRAIKGKVDEVVKNVIYDKAGTYGPATGSETVEGNVTISVRDVMLQNIVITGDLLLAEGIGDGDVTLKNVTVKGNTVIKGGGSHSVVLEDCNLPSITVSKEGVRVVASGSTTVNVVTLESGATIVTATTSGPGIETVVVSKTIPANSSITLTGNFTAVNVNANQVSVTMEGGTVGTVTVAENTTGTSLQVASTATVTNLTLNSAATVTGSGAITTATVNAAGSSISQTPTTLTPAPNVSVKVGNTTVTTSPTGVTTTTTTSSGGSGGSSTVSVSAINVTSGTAKVGVVLTAGALTPASATASYQWQICDTVGGAYVNIAGAIASTYTPVPGNENNFIKVVATGTGSYSGTVTSAAIGAVASVDNSALAVAPVDLGTAGNYAILAKTGISSVPASVITGNIGVSPAAASYITGFSLTADSTNVFSKSNQVSGNVYASDYAVPTPANLTTAISDMETAYTTAAGRAANYTELYTGDISGKTLTAGVYKWGTGVLINSDVTLSGGANDVWIFQIAKGITQANGTSIILTGGAQAKNIFWQAAETVAIGTTAHFEGIILGMKEITLGTNASINGRLLAQTAVTLDASTVVAPTVDL